MPLSKKVEEVIEECVRNGSLMHTEVYAEDLYDLAELIIAAHDEEKEEKKQKTCDYESFWDCHANKAYCKKHFRII